MDSLIEARSDINSTPPQIAVQPLLRFAQLRCPVERLGINQDGGSRILRDNREGDIPPYPNRLEKLLRESFDGRMIDILNRGVGGEEAPKERKRIDTDVLLEQPRCAALIDRSRSQRDSDFLAVRHTVEVEDRGIRIVSRLLVLLLPLLLCACKINETATQTTEIESTLQNNCQPADGHSETTPLCEW
jgi:hypothetical protein